MEFDVLHENDNERFLVADDIGLVNLGQLVCSVSITFQVVVD